MGNRRSPPKLPAGMDEQGYKQMRSRMRASVLLVWRGVHEVIAGADPWDVVDEAWASMAEQDFRCQGPFLPHALRVAKNKAIDVVRSAEERRRAGHLDAPLTSGLDAPEETTMYDVLEGSDGAETEYFRRLDEVSKVKRLALAEEAIYEPNVLSDTERHVFLAVRVDQKSGAAVGRELDPPISGQRVGQIVAKAFIKIEAYVRDHEGQEGEQGDGTNGPN